MEARSQIRLSRWMMFVDGENLSIQGKTALTQMQVELVSGGYYQPDVFLWARPRVELSEPRLIPEALLDTPLERYAIRWHYYTAVRGDDQRLDSVRDCLQSLGFTPSVFKKAKGDKSKGVDITLARDLLSHAYKDNFDAAVLVAGDADFVPLVDEVKRLGKQVFVLFFDNASVGPELKRSTDGFFDIGPWLRSTWAK